MTRAKTRKRRPLLTLLLILALIPIGGVVLHRFVPPLFTILMVKQAVAGHGMDYRWRSLDHISPRLVEAVIAAEDARFCSHHGFDMEAIDKALDSNARGGRVRGGSTISQQVAKNLFLWQGGGYFRKGIEAWYTLLIELMWPKTRILEVYANVAEFGDGIYGAQAASRSYWHKDADKLSPAESARLAAVLPSPRRYSVSRPGPYVQRRANWIQRQSRQIGGTDYLETLD